MDLRHRVEEKSLTCNEKLQLLYKPIWPAPASKTAFLTFQDVQVHKSQLKQVI